MKVTLDLMESVLYSLNIDRILSIFNDFIVIHIVYLMTSYSRKSLAVIT